ncbi:MAG: AMP-binding protein, partial [Thermoanaerobaculia bacterium]|nr:AMP-binding protein [Thermoanaerobaculia bacterium]
LHTPLRSGTSVWFVTDLERLGDALQDVRPTLFFGVPRVWEKIAARIQAKGAEASGLRKKLIAWARRAGLDGGYAEQERRSKPWSFWLAERLVFRKVRERIGLDQAKLCVSSAAPISMETLEFFLSLGIPIDEVYGMSECTGPTTMSLPGVRRIGKAGMVAPGTELKTLDDGEILIRGPHVFLGYYKDDDATRRVLDDEGWLHSGDVGEIDSDGFLEITDRKKDLIITAGGHNISPQNIEKQLQGIEGVSQAVVVGDRRSYLVALLTIDREKLRSVAASVASGAVDSDTARKCPRLRAYLQKKIDQVNETLARSETIKKFHILPNEFDIETGELTPTMKIRRRFVTEKYDDEIEQLYSS